MLSRRTFIVATGTALFAPYLTWTEEPPKLLDHVLLGCSNLEDGLAFVEKLTGIHAAFGGVHPGRGTQNALLSLGDRHYLEIIAPDPKQPTSPGPQQFAELKNLSQPRLIGWAAHPGNVENYASKLRALGIGFTGPTVGSRTRPDGRTLHWKTLNLSDNHSGVLPFFIEWSADSIHPSMDAPSGCRLDLFAVGDPNPAALTKILQQLALDVPVERSDRPQLRARITGPRGTLDASS